MTLECGEFLADSAPGDVISSDLSGEQSVQAGLNGHEEWDLLENTLNLLKTDLGKYRPGAFEIDEGTNGEVIDFPGRTHLVKKGQSRPDDRLAGII